ncbi:hypothetical protein PVAND_015120 [Polypedilum vanderplanki]|uniref:Uncharacterized protein n=1 Tax=Polypedilum vanderplanki TaxID=319348 RepID=A0A9J6BB64_POLVA|nr:hypothetical protein PVAND_015120 [Polypedilum vanderplanki]
MKLIFLIFCCILNFSSTQIIFNCRFNTDFDWLIIGRVYMCTLQGNYSITTKNESVTNVIGEHKLFKNNNYVLALWMLYLEMFYLPIDITKRFRHIAGLTINHSQLKEIHKSDLEPFYKLRELYLIGNEIEIIEANLFEFNKRLELLWIDGNKIKRIQTGAFNGLEKLKYLNVREEKCMLKKVQYDHHAVLKLIEMIERKCFK